VCSVIPKPALPKPLRISKNLPSSSGGTLNLGLGCKSKALFLISSLFSFLEHEHLTFKSKLKKLQHTKYIIQGIAGDLCCYIMFVADKQRPVSHTTRITNYLA
jgi:hypothetical protein